MNSKLISELTGIAMKSNETKFIAVFDNETILDSLKTLPWDEQNETLEEAKEYIASVCEKQNDTLFSRDIETHRIIKITVEEV